jgi:ABC-type nitrate/sulfonate/bicarbonate transport system ATPase subunit
LAGRRQANHEKDDAVEALEIRNVSKQFRIASQNVEILKDIHLDVAPGEFVSLVGLSGCGKTTLLRLVVGLDSQYEGAIFLGGQRLNGPSRKRGIVFQEPRLFPWLTIERNVGLSLDRQQRKKCNGVVREHLELVGLKGYEKMFPGQLSGGMAQRAAIARALVAKPALLLLDEPLGALDALTRLYMQRELERIWQQEKTTMLMVTHDIDEAIQLSDRVAVMSCRPGQIKAIIPVNLPRPRNRESDEFAVLRAAILQEFDLLESGLTMNKGIYGDGI